jgi:hypothetical protein
MSRPLVQSVLRGDVTRAEYTHYMSDVCCYALHSSQVIAIAGARLVLSHPQMAEYLFRQAGDNWGTKHGPFPICWTLE